MDTNSIKTLSEARAVLERLHNESSAKDSLLAKVQGELADLKERAQSLESTLASRDQEVAALRDDLSAANELLSESQNKQSEAIERAQSFEKQIASLTEKNRTLDAEVNRLKALDMDADKRAAEICASMGVSPVEATPKGDAQSNENLLEQFRSIQSPGAQMAFYRKHRDDINALASTSNR